MKYNYHIVLGKEKKTFYKSIEVGQDSCVEFEKITWEQSKMTTCHTLRANRITASVCGDIVIRKKGFIWIVYYGYLLNYYVFISHDVWFSFKMHFII